MIKNLSFYYCIILTVFSSICSYADENTPLVGHWRSTKDEIASATDIVIGKFTQVRAGGAGSISGLEYHGAITVLHVLKGNASGNVEVVFRVILGSKDKEAEPDLGDTYIIILYDHQMIRKLLPATDANIAKVKALIAAAPVPK
jgi:hypothetical protein